jgi:hypothetical protein
MLTELCAFLKNWFEVEMLYGDFKITDGVVTYADGTELPLQEGQYFRIIGSIFNDGVFGSFSYTPEAHPLNTGASGGLKNETFSGSVWLLAIPKEVIALADEISAWQAKYEGADSAAMSPFNSESFGGYSYSKSGGASGAGGSGTGAGGWQGAFANKLARYRKV